MGDLAGKVQSGQNYSVAHIGSLEGLEQFKGGKLFLKEDLNLTGTEISLNRMAAGTETPFSHKHKQNEEIYIVVKGKGQFLVDGEMIEVQEGSVLRVATDGDRAWRADPEEDMYFICIQAKQDSLEQWTATDGILVQRPVSWPK